MGSLGLGFSRQLIRYKWCLVRRKIELQVLLSKTCYQITSLIVILLNSLNEVSSRSHTVLLVKICKKSSVSATNSLKLSVLTASEREAFRGGITTTTSVLYLVDLAGSERIKKSKVSGDRLDEAISINSSLSVLGNQSI